MLHFCDADGCLRQNFRNGCGNGRDLHAGVDIHPRWTHPIRHDSDHRPGGVGTGDRFRFGKKGRQANQERKERPADKREIAKYRHNGTKQIVRLAAFGDRRAYKKLLI